MNTKTGLLTFVDTKKQIDDAMNEIPHNAGLEFVIPGKIKMNGYFGVNELEKVFEITSDFRECVHEIMNKTIESTRNEKVNSKEDTENVD